MSNTTSVNVAIVGASGYSGEELVRLLLGHPQARLVAVTSRQYAGQSVAQVFPRFASQPAARALKFSEPDAAALAKLAQLVSEGCHADLNLEERSAPRQAGRIRVQTAIWKRAWAAPSVQAGWPPAWR